MLFFNVIFFFLNSILAFNSKRIDFLLNSFFLCIRSLWILTLFFKIVRIRASKSNPCLKIGIVFRNKLNCVPNRNSASKSKMCFLTITSDFREIRSFLFLLQRIKVFTFKVVYLFDFFK